MRTYDVGIAALALDVPRKWLDNLLSQHDVPGVIAARRGIARRITHDALIRLALVRELHRTLGVGVRDALGQASEFVNHGEALVLSRGHLRVLCDREGLAADVAEHIREALESAPTPRRGRLPRRRPPAADDLTP